MPRKKIDYIKIGREYAKHGNLKEAMVTGGFSSTSASRGLDSMSEKGKEIFAEASTKQVEKSNAVAIRLSEKMGTEKLRHAARGHLIQNMGERTDKGIQTLKTIAQLAETSMLNPENVTGVMVIHMPPAFSPGGRLDPEAFAAKLPEAQLTSSKPPELIDRRSGGCGWDHNFKAPEVPKDDN